MIESIATAALEGLKSLEPLKLAPESLEKISNYVNNPDHPIGTVDSIGEPTPSHSYLITRNEGLAGDVHPITGVPFEHMSITLLDGSVVEGVFPRFDSVFETVLPNDLLEASDKVQFSYCNKQLQDAIEADPSLKAQFSKEQLKQIANGLTPDGYTWHHDAETGKMQLVNTTVHANTGHTGGRAVWGGGTENR